MMLAQALEQVWRAPTEQEQLELLRTFTGSEVPEVSVGAFSILADAAPDELKKFVQNLNWASVPVQSQRMLDETMFKVDKQEWKESPKRKELLEHWQTRFTDEEQAILILPRLDTAIQRKQIDPVTLWSILRPLIGNDKYSEKVQGGAINVTRWIINDPAVRDEAFDVLIKIIDSSASESQKLTAANTLRHLTKVSPDQLGYLVVYRDQFASSIEDKQSMKGKIAVTLAETVRNLTAAKKKSE